MSRQCSKTGCSGPAVATLTYVYRESTAVLGPLATYAEPHTYDLCSRHAERTHRTARVGGRQAQRRVCDAAARPPTTSSRWPTPCARRAATAHRRAREPRPAAPVKRRPGPSRSDDADTCGSCATREAVYRRAGGSRAYARPPIPSCVVTSPTSSASAAPPGTRRLADFIKAYDVRGLVPEQLDERRRPGHRLGVRPGRRQPRGRRPASSSGTTCAPSSPSLSRAFADGVASHGVDVTLIGLCSTDGLYYASGALDLPGAMFTASHNPAQYNGIKLCRVRRAPGRPGHRTGRDPRPGAVAARRYRRARRPPTGAAGTITRARRPRRLRRVPARPGRPEPNPAR